MTTAKNKVDSTPKTENLGKEYDVKAIAEKMELMREASAIYAIPTNKRTVEQNNRANKIYYADDDNSVLARALLKPYDLYLKDIMWKAEHWKKFNEMDSLAEEEFIKIAQNRGILDAILLTNTLVAEATLVTLNRYKAENIELFNGDKFNSNEFGQNPEDDIMD